VPGGGNTTSPSPEPTANGEIRASRVIGAAVYNGKDQKIGSVDDILLDKDHKATQAVISVGGVLGVARNWCPCRTASFSSRLRSATSLAV
jgi:hypothetical protein